MVSSCCAACGPSRLPDEIDAIRDACGFAEDALAAADAALDVGCDRASSHRRLHGSDGHRPGSRLPRRRTSPGSPPREHPWRRSSRDTAVGRAIWWPSTRVSSPADTSARSADPSAGGWRSRRGAVPGALATSCGIGCCRPAAPGRRFAGLLDAYDAAGVPAPPIPVARGLGLGIRPSAGERRSAADCCRAASRSRHGACAHSLRLAGRRRGALPARSRLSSRAPGPNLLSTKPLREARSPIT